MLRILTGELRNFEELEQLEELAMTALKKLALCALLRSLAMWALNKKEHRAYVQAS